MASYESKEVFRLPSAFTGSSEDGDGYYPGDDDTEALDAVDGVLDVLVVLLEHTHGWVKATEASAVQFNCSARGHAK